jgi:uncharacterized protein YecE (DUF72 family)
MKYYIGCSGWSYKGWIGKFYPGKINPSEFLPYYAKHFNTAEVNSTFYRLPFEGVVKGWYKKTPSDFCFSLKISRTITHYRKLKDVEEPLKIFFERISPLKEKTGAILHQFPPSLKIDDELLKEYLKKLPENYQHAIEFRHSSWFRKEIYKILTKYNIALVIINSPNWEEIWETTANFSYIRMHGAESLYNYCYKKEELEELYKKISKKFKNIEKLYVYFNNDYNAYAVENANYLISLFKNE